MDINSRHYIRSDPRIKVLAINVYDDDDDDDGTGSVSLSAGTASSGVPDCSVRLSTGNASSSMSLCSIKNVHWYCFVKCVVS